MARSKRTGVRSAGQLLDHLMIDRKKMAVAFGLVAILAIMWGRVLLGRKPAAAMARETVTRASVRPEPPRQVRFVELPKVPGRNDTIERDFFAVQDRACFRPKGSARNPSADPEVHVVSPDHAQEVIRRIAQRLKVEAVLWSENPQAFINDQLRRVGEKITLKEGTGSFEFEVLRIYEDSVLVGCNGTRLTLKLAQDLDVHK